MAPKGHEETIRAISRLTLQAQPTSSFFISLAILVPSFA